MLARHSILAKVRAAKLRAAKNRATDSHTAIPSLAGGVPRLPSILAPVFIGCLLLLLLGCGDGGLGRYFSYEERMDKASPPDTIDELKTAIKDYGEEVERVVDARRKVGMYQRMLANRYLQEGLYGPCYDAALLGLESYPSDSQLYYALAVSSSWLAKSTAVGAGPASARHAELLAVAERSWRRMLELSPRSTRAMYGLAVLLVFELSRSEEALPLLESLIAIETLNIDALFLRGRVRYELGDLEGAANDYALIVKTTKVEDKKAQAEANLRAIEEVLYGPDGRP